MTAIDQFAAHVGLCKYPCKPNHSLLEIFRQTDYVRVRLTSAARSKLPVNLGCSAPVFLLETTK